MTGWKHAVLAACGAALFAGPASQAAQPGPPHCPPGHAKKGWCDDRGDRRGERDAYEAGYRDGQRDAWSRGDRIPHERDWREIRDYERHGYSAPPRGHRYYEVDGEVYLIETATRLVVEALAGGR